MSEWVNGEFVVRGSKPPLGQRSSGFLSASQLTATSRRLTQSSLYSPDNYRGSGHDLDNGILPGTYLNGQEGTLYTTNTMTSTNGLTANGSTSKRVSRMTGLVNGNVDDDVGGYSDASNDHEQGEHCTAKPPREAQWYTKPPHLERKEYPVLQGVGLSSRTVTPLDRSVGTIGASIAAKKAANSKLISAKELESYPLTDMDGLARDNFPLTLGAAYTLRSVTPPSPLPVPSSITISPPPTGIIRPNTKPWKPKKFSRSTSSKRPASASSNSHSNSSSSSVDRMYLMTSESPVTGSSTVLLSTPFQSELARLRMERLRLEEEHLLEVKRQEELERIRGPKAKWYEMKSPAFHYEAHKNTELLRNKENWQELLDYRNELTQASKEFRRSYTGISDKSC